MHFVNWLQEYMSYHKSWRMFGFGFGYHRERQMIGVGSQGRCIAEEAAR